MGGPRDSFGLLVRSSFARILLSVALLLIIRCAALPVLCLAAAPEANVPDANGLEPAVRAGVRDVDAAEGDAARAACSPRAP